MLGKTSTGIAKELECVLSCTKICATRSPPILPLTCFETAILKLASNIPIPVAGIWPKQTHCLPGEPERDWKVTCQGIRSYLYKIIARQLDKLPSSPNHTILNSELPIIPDSWSPDIGEPEVINPYSNDFYCQLCKCELANVYFKCVYCLKQYKQDINFCMSCIVQPKSSNKKCKNHKQLQQHFRFYPPEQLRKMLQICHMWINGPSE